MDMKVDASALGSLLSRLERAPKVIQGAKRQAMEIAAPKLKFTVDREIGGSGKVRGWQGSYVGSRGGYAAVRPQKGTYVETKGKQKMFRAGPKKYAVGYVTNAIDHGHRWPRNQWGFRGTTAQVSGKEFYQRAQAQAEQVAQEAGEQIVQALVEHLEG